MYAHKVLASMLAYAKDPDTREFARPFFHFLVESIRYAHRIHIQNVAELAERTGVTKITDVKLSTEYREFIRLPFDLLWIDFIVGGQKGGILARTARKDKETIDPDRLNMFVFSELQQGWVCLYPFVTTLDMSTGSVIIEDTKLLSKGITQKEMDDIFEKGEETIHGVATASCYTLLSVLLAINCKNIEEVIVYPSRKLNKKRERRGKLPMLEFRQLRIIPNITQKVFGDDPVPVQNPGSTRLHFCRGHIKVFTEDKPLFGKYTGVYWWNPHMRGNKARGSIVKEYIL